MTTETNDERSIDVAARILRDAFRGVDPHPLDAVALASLTLMRLDPELAAAIQREPITRPTVVTPDTVIEYIETTPK